MSEAERIYRRILSTDSQNADCLHLLGMIAFQSEQYEQAVELIGSAIAIHGGAASYHSNLGNVLQAQGLIDEAELCYRRALAINPEQAVVHLNLGHLFKAQGEVDASVASYRQAIALKPELAEARASLATVLLLRGEFAEGWREYEQRWRTRTYDTPWRNYPQPLWHGERLTSGRLLIWGEQGIGDEIMFAGLYPEIIAGGTRCLIECDPRLQPLFGRSFPEAAMVSGYDATGSQDWQVSAHLPSGSLPRLLRGNREAFASTKSPYLFADPPVRRQFRNRYEDGRWLIGLAWHTRSKQAGPSRSIDLSLLAPLFSQSNVRWVSLQYGDHEELERQATEAQVPLTIDRDVSQFHDIDEFAGQVAAMDLVIAIDNSTAHLAAALGVPTWLLLPFAPDWRWLLDREDSLWYPGLRMFRQERRGDWRSVVELVRIELAKKLLDKAR